MYYLTIKERRQKILNTRGYLIQIMEVLVQPSITISDLSILTKQSYEKSRQVFNRIKDGYEQSCTNGSKLPNSREIPLNDYTLNALNQMYGIDKERIIENIKILDEISKK